MRLLIREESLEAEKPPLLPKHLKYTHACMLVTPSGMVVTDSDENAISAGILIAAPANISEESYLKSI